MRLNPHLLIAGLLCCCVCGTATGDSATTISKEEVRSAISVFRQDPLSPSGRAAGEVVRSFAEKNDSVLLNVNDKIAPFLSNIKLSQEDRALLLDACVVGAVDTQLLKNERKDDPYGAATEMIRVYKQMQKADPNFALPEIDKLVAMETRGELKKYVESP
jgi:hypothetical protein